MDSDVKKKWIDALRSGTYKQAHERLRRGDRKMCCLGVLCDLYNQEHEESYWDEEVFIAGRYSKETVLPPPVMKWAGINNSSGDCISLSGVEVTLADLNDGFDNYDTAVEERSFEEIADIIEKHL